jgi:DNA-binding LacI/PurR family transcriptional regulator
MSRPAVLIGKPDDRTELPYVEFDFEGAGRLCAEHLLAEGHRKIGFIGRPPLAYERQEGYAMRALHGATEALRTEGLDLRSAPCEPTAEGVEQALSEIFDDGDAPTALIVHNGIALIFLPQALRRIGRALGRDVSVVAISADEHAVRVSPPVSNVGVPEYALGTSAVELLVARLDNAAAGNEVWLTPELTIRDREDSPVQASASSGEGRGI